MGEQVLLKTYDKTKFAPKGKIVTVVAQLNRDSAKDKDKDDRMEVVNLRRIAKLNRKFQRRENIDKEVKRYPTRIREKPQRYGFSSATDVSGETN